MRFSMTMTDRPHAAPEVFTEDDAPKWLCEGGYPGSTMCNRRFWNGHVLTLPVGGSVKTDFRTITRLE